jgi:hypothetical protein
LGLMAWLVATAKLNGGAINVTVRLWLYPHHLLV